jgi:hypothetical protein
MQEGKMQGFLFSFFFFQFYDVAEVAIIHKKV